MLLLLLWGMDPVLMNCDYVGHVDRLKGHSKAMPLLISKWFGSHYCPTFLTPWVLVVSSLGQSIICYKLCQISVRHSCEICSGKIEDREIGYGVSVLPWIGLARLQNHVLSCHPCTELRPS
jgi:hypothetical protein